MNIGILTYHWVSNFGANLQALSTYRNIELAGHHPIFINWIPYDLEQYYKTVVPEVQNRAHREFAEKYFKCTTICRTSAEVASVIKSYNIGKIVIGSDAVFTYLPKLRRLHLSRKSLIGYSKPCVDSDFPNPYWGDFISIVPTSVKVCALSASAQNTQYKSILFKRPFDKALSRFSFISVRDIWTKNMIEYLTNAKISPEITPDPVFGFEQNVQPKITKGEIVNKFKISSKYAIVSITDKNVPIEWIEQLSQIFLQKGIQLISLDQTNKTLVSKMSRHISFPIDPLDWYSLIKYSEGYIGELMHPILVSLHNSVPVYALDLYGFNKNGKLDEESSKTYQILNHFELLSNYYNKKNDSALPRPSDVVEKIVSFDRIKCSQKAQKMYEKYNKLMKHILEI